MIKNMINFCEVKNNNENHVKILFELLLKRKYFISNREKTTFEDHMEFVRNYPYRKWFIILKGDHPIGSCYCTFENVIGLNLISEDEDIYKQVIIKFISKVSPLKPKPSLINKSFTVNVPNQNKILQNALLGLGSQPIQITFLLN